MNFVPGNFSQSHGNREGVPVTLTESLRLRASEYRVGADESKVHGWGSA